MKEESFTFVLMCTDGKPTILRVKAHRLVEFLQGLCSSKVILGENLFEVEAGRDIEYLGSEP